jgi:hypothetical protein
VYIKTDRPREHSFLLDNTARDKQDDPIMPSVFFMTVRPDWIHLPNGKSTLCILDHKVLLEKIAFARSKYLAGDQ